MGWVERLPSGGWRACWRNPEGARRSRSFPTQREAKAHLRHQQSAIDKGTYVDASAGRITFGDYARHYYTLAARRLRRTSYARDIDYLNNHVLPRWGAVPLSRIRKAEVETWVAGLAEPGVRRRGEGTLAPATIDQIYQVFRKVMAAAVEDERIPRLPCPKNPPIEKGKRKAVRFLTEAEIAKLAGAIGPRYEAMIYVAAYGGLRLGELAALRLDDVDWDRKTIRVDEALSDVGGHLSFEDPKSARAFRTIPMADVAMDHLWHHIESRRSDDARAMVFSGPDGGLLRATNWRARIFNPAVKAAGLEPLTPTTCATPPPPCSSPRALPSGSWRRSSAMPTPG
jgi:integrase